MTTTHTDRPDRYVARAIDAYAAVPDSEVQTYHSSTHWDVKQGCWVTFDPATRTYVRA